jgi:glyoxylase-like metal-dependent hydrolase (beta-lactamase superfamily II)
MDDNTIVIPGHGPLANKGDVLATASTLELALTRLREHKSKGDSLGKTVVAKPLADIEEKWGKVIFSADQWIRLVWENI